MSDTKHPADALADRIARPFPVSGPDADRAAAMLRTIPALEAERDKWQGEVERLKAQAAQPLTDEQIRAERNRIGAAHGFMDGVRFAERAHGIGKEPKP